MQRSAVATQARLDWADVAKAISIIGVCVLHSIIAVPGGGDSTWKAVYQVLDPIRMPLFFMVSGLFAHRVITRSLSDLFFRRIWFLLVPYLSFKTIAAVVREISDPGYQTVRQFLRSVVVGDPGLWFLYVLMVFNLVAWGMRKVPPALVVALSFLPGLAYGVFGLNEFEKYNEISHIVLYLPAFMIGLHARRLWLRLGEVADPDRVRSPFTAYAVAALAVGAYLAWWVLDATTTGLLGYVIGRLSGVILAVPVAIVAVVHLTKMPVVSRILSAIGRNTLPIYVSHPLVIWMVGAPLGDAVVAHGSGSFTEVDIRILLNLLLCTMAGFVMYLIGKIPVVNWVLYPPPLPRGRADGKNVGRRQASTRAPRGTGLRATGRLRAADDRTRRQAAEPRN
ncbi:acyltransferase family protein [Corynebacterium freneyi]|uniref:acyltransferase family protein n=1 Tax=Corynebacterium freneyi TaxID=134034 RepID=UPI00068B4CC8|nr:acyltransferase family protein [Corynebacterium freneyi]